MALLTSKGKNNTPIITTSAIMVSFMMGLLIGMTASQTITETTTKGTTTTPIGCRPVTCFPWCPTYAPCPPPKLCMDGSCLGCPYAYQCSEDEICADGFCVVSCDEGMHLCQPGQICVDGSCADSPGLP